jgi:DNA-binding NtrC family response regulator
MTDTILWVDDDPQVIESMSGLLSDHGISVHPAYTLDSGRDRLLHRTGDGAVPYQAAVIDLRLDEGDGLELADEAISQGIPVVLMTGYATVEDTIRAFQQGVADVLVKPVTDLQLIESLGLCMRENLETGSPGEFNTPFLVGRTPEMQQVIQLVDAVADTPATVLITGESGSGKSLLAREIHRRSQRSDGPFVEVSCGALSESLLESELFGHVKGAFTGADRDRVGKIATASGGTIFLDEIGTASSAMQIKLLRFLQSMEYEPVGSSETVRSSARVMLATNQRLDEMVADGSFREDLYYRVNVMNISLPSLRDRPEDIEILSRIILEEANQCLGREVLEIDMSALELLRHHAWPGNIRELKNVIERAVLLCRGNVLTAASLTFTQTSPILNPPALPAGITLKKAMMGPERRFIKDALARCSGNRGNAAKTLGINRTTLYKKMKRLGLEVSGEPSHDDIQSPLS